MTSSSPAARRFESPAGREKLAARTVNRDDIRQGVEELGVELDGHVRFVIEALKPVQERIGLKVEEREP